jgi:hypothetical protein
MMGNDVLGDCTCAAAGHMIECWTANVDPSQTYVAPDADIVKAYADVSGYNAATGEGAENGAVILNVLNYWRNTGVSGRNLFAYMAIETGNTRQIQLAVSLFGGCYIGLQLPVSAKNQETWSMPPGGPIGQGAPGSWGGHAVPVLAYDSDGLTVITWGQKQRMTWGFYQTYCDEAYALLSMDFFNTQNIDPAGFQLDALRADLNRITE